MTDDPTSDDEQPDAEQSDAEQSEGRSEVDPLAPFEDVPDEDNPRIDDPDAETPSLEGETAGPLDDVASRVRERRDEDAGEYDDLFEEYDAADVDSEELWEQIRSDDPVGVDTGAADEPHERVVETSSYCEKCEYFSDPPEMRCTHEGTEIVELVDVETVRLRNCPVVQEEERLETIRDGE